MMRVKKKIQRLLESRFHLHVDSTRPHGRDDCHDIRASGLPIRMIFDAGANDGASARKFLDAFPDATIHSFEPVGSTFDALRRNMENEARVHCHRLALGAAEGEATIYLTQHTSMNSLIRPEHVLGEETVLVTTIDAFAQAKAIDRADLLKIDTEGNDLEVLRGAERMLRDGRIAFVLAEVGFHRGDCRHVLFDDVRDFLAPHGFAVFGIYDQQPEWSGERRLRYANACFLREAGSS
jgi:FkbM family methyltransferase